MKHPILSVIIVSYNTKELTKEAIHSLDSSLAQGNLSKDKIQVIVVDNHSTDGSVPELKKSFDGRIQIIENSDNVGFAKANNQGVRSALGEFVLLLNSDTVVQPGALEKLIEAMYKDSKLGIVTAQLYYPNGRYQPQGGSLPNLLNIWAWWLWPFAGIMPGITPYQDKGLLGEGKVVYRGWVGGTALMMRKELYETLGGLDERLFMYAEDVDLCARVREQGLKIGVVANARIIHLGSASGSSFKAKLGEVKGLLYFFKKHKSGWQVLVLRLILLKGAILRYLYFGILKQEREAKSLYAQILAVSTK